MITLIILHDTEFQYILKILINKNCKLFVSGNTESLETI